MKIYSLVVPTGLTLPMEWVYVEEDAPDFYYQDNKQLTDREVITYTAASRNGMNGYKRVKYKRLYEMYYKEMNSLEELESWLKECHEKGIWFEIGYRDGIMQIDPWPE